MSGSNSGATICWDSCIFLAWLKNETDKPLDAIEEYLRKIKDNQINLVVSAISYAEVLDNAKTGSKAGSEFRNFVKRPNVIIANLDERVGLKAAEIRQCTLEALSRNEITQGIKIPDAIIAASAVIYKATDIHSFDPVLQEISKWDLINKIPVRSPADALITPLGI